MTVFILCAVLMVVLVLLTLLVPVLRRPPSVGSASHAQGNAAILRDQYAKLERDRDEGLISDADATLAQAELRRLMVLEALPTPTAAPAAPASRRSLVALAVVLPLVAVGAYVGLGHPDAIEQASAPRHLTEADYKAMVQALETRLQGEPDNLKGWVMLGRSYKVMGRPADAERAYARAETLIATDAQLLADYADVVATNARGRFDGKPDQLIAQALRLDPENLMALWLSGTSALSRHDTATTVRQWRHALSLLPPDSEDARTLSAAIAEVAPQEAGAAPAASPTPAAHPPGQQAAASRAAVVRGVVELDPGLQARLPAGATLMVIARAPGVRMPLAVLRVPVGAWPAGFTLDDSLSLSPQSLLSAQPQIEVEARVSATGMARPEPGDLLSKAQVVKAGADGVHLRLDHVRP